MELFDLNSHGKSGEKIVRCLSEPWLGDMSVILGIKILPETITNKGSIKTMGYFVAGVSPQGTRNIKWF